MFYRLAAIGLTLSLAAFPAPTYGQRPPSRGAANALAQAESGQPVRRGDRVRVRVAGPSRTPLVGLVLALTADTLYLSPEQFGAGHRAVPFDRIEALERSRGVRTRIGPGALGGLLVGSVTGALIGSSQVERQTCDLETEGLSCLTPATPEGGGEALTIALAGALGGLALGAVVGHLIKTETWETLHLDAIDLRLGLAGPPSFSVSVPAP